MDDLGDLKEICDIKPFDEIYVSTDDDEPMPQISYVCSAKNDSLPEASKVKYYRIYHDFKNWQKKKNVNTISEPLLMEYFQEMSVKQKPTSLWAYYSMLKRTFQVNLNTDITSYHQLLAFLKANSSGYEPVKSKNFTLEEVVKFVVEAPDEVWLDVKTVCIFGVCGSLKNGELRSIKYCDVEQHGNILLVRVEDCTTKTCRSFTITGEFFNIVKKYLALRPLHTPADRFFLNYQRERCTVQPIGKNKLARMPHKIAQYLSLPEPDKYTGQAFRLSGQMIMKNTSQTIDGRMIENIARHYSSRSNSAPSVSRIDDTLHDTEETDHRILDDEYCKTECDEIEPVPEATNNFSVENLLKVDNLRLHCTVCDTHLGCSVSNEGNIRTHPTLFVTQCKDCHTYYKRRVFTKGTDGSDLQCRWCAQGGEVYSCSTCPCVFCRKCILQNLSKNVITEIEKNDNWRCFSCIPSAISHLKAQHWALTNHLRQTKIQIRAMKDSDQLYEMMYQDPTLCCKGKEPLNSRQIPKDKRRCPGDNSHYNSSSPDPKRLRNHSVVCTPRQPAEESVTSGTMSYRTPTQAVATVASQKSATPPPILIRQVASSSTEPPPLTLRPLHSLSSERPASPLRPIDLPLISSAVQSAAYPNSQLPAVTQPGSSEYQTYNILVDLAAKDDTFVRLPNGRLIQVRPPVITEPTHQTAGTLPPVLIQNNASYAVRNQAPSAQTTNRPSLKIVNLGQQQTHLQPNVQQRQQPLTQQPPLQIINVGQPLQQPALQQHRKQSLIQQKTLQPPLQIINVGQPLRQHQLVQQQPLIPSQKPLQRTHLQEQQSNGVSNALITPIPHPSAPTLKKYPDTPLGQTQTVLEKEVHSAKEICQQIVGKCNALMKSTAYNSVQSFHDVRDLHQHLSYLCTYAVDRFTTLKGKCTDTMKSLATAHEETRKLMEDEGNYTNVDDDVQVFEPVTECIEIDSDGESEPPPVDVKIEHSDRTSHLVESSGTANVQASTDIIDGTDNDEFELPRPPVLSAYESGSYDLYDAKLNGTPIVVLEKDAKIERKLQEILERQNSERVAGSPSDHEFSIQTNNSAATRKSPMSNGDENTVQEMCHNSETNHVDRADEKMTSNDDDKNGPPVGDHQAKDEEHIEDTQSDERNKISHKELDGDVEVDRAIDPGNQNVNVGFDHLTRAQKDDKDGASVDGSVSDSSLIGLQNPHVSDNSDHGLLDEMDRQNNLSEDSFENLSSPDTFDVMPRNEAAENIVTLSTDNADPDLV